MADFSVSTKITAQNRSTAAIKAAAAGLRNNLGPSLAKSAAAARKLTGTLASTAKRMAFLGAAAASAAAFGIAKLVQSHVESLDALGEMSERVGVSAEAIQEWRHVAQRAGSSAEAFDAGLEGMSKRVGQAILGQGKLAGMLKKTAPAFLAALKGAGSNEERLQLLIDGMRTFEDPAARAAFAAAAFGDAGTELALIAGKSAEEIAALRKESIAFGRASNDQVAQAGAMADSMDSLEASLAGAATAIGAELVPALKPLIEDLTKWVTANKQILATRIREVVMGVVEAAKDLAKWLGEGDWSGLWKDLKEFGETLDRMAQSVGGGKTALIGLGAVMLGSQVLGAFASFGTAAALAMNPIVLTLAGITASVLAVQQMMDAWGGGATKRKLDEGVFNVRGPDLPSSATREVAASETVGQRVAPTFKELLFEQASVAARVAAQGGAGRPDTANLATGPIDLGRGMSQSGKIDVTINHVNAPPGTTVETTSSGKALDVKTTKATGRRSTVAAQR